MLRPITLAALLGLAPAAHALTVTKTTTFDLHGPDSGVGVTALIDRFDPALGTLGSATFDLHGILTPRIDFAADAIPATVPFDATERVFANFGIIPAPGSSKSFTDGRTEALGLVQTGPNAFHSVGGLGFSFDFTGAITTADATGPGKWDVLFGGESRTVQPLVDSENGSQITAVLTATYVYTPGADPTSVPEPIGAALLPAGLLGLAAARRGRPRMDQSSSCRHADAGL